MHSSNLVFIRKVSILMFLFGICRVSPRVMRWHVMKSCSEHQYFTSVDIPSSFESDKKLDYSTPVLLLGSWYSSHILTIDISNRPPKNLRPPWYSFTENIYMKLKERKFDVYSNPTGIVFNPLSLAESLSRCDTHTIFTTHPSFVSRNMMW